MRYEKFDVSFKWEVILLRAVEFWCNSLVGNDFSVSGLALPGLSPRKRKGTKGQKKLKNNQQQVFAGGHPPNY
jgi:hypothetical protein